MAEKKAKETNKTVVKQTKKEKADQMTVVKLDEKEKPAQIEKDMAPRMEMTEITEVAGGRK
jgi:hypothetical protein